MKSLFMGLVSVFFFSLTYSSAPTEFTYLDITGLTLLIVLILIFEVMLCYLIARSRIYKNIVLTIFTLVNIISLNLILNEYTLHLPAYIWYIGIVVFTFIIFTMMKIIDETHNGGKFLIGITTIALVGVLTIQTQSVDRISFKVSSEGKTSAENIKLVDFKIKPNIYMVSFDALIPQTILKKNLGLESVAYNEVLNQNFRSFKNFFADYTPTARSLSSLLALDKRYFLESMKSDSPNEFFRGVTPSPLFEVFSHNGYKTNTIYNSNYFGRIQGPYVDNYFSLNLGICEFLNNKSVTFFGYCTIIESELFKSLMNRIGLGSMLSIDVNPVKYLIENMRKGLKAKTPQIFLSYIWSPGHVPGHEPGGLDLESYKKSYLERSKETASYIQQLVDFVSSEDPNAILYVFGDHGVWLSKFMKFEENKTFFVQDRFAIYGGIFPSNRCLNSFSKPYTDEFMTISQGGHMIIRCLTGGENAFVEQDIYRLPSRETKKENYEAYLYE